jgi:hypothetical protein
MLKTILIASALALPTTAFAQTQQNQGPTRTDTKSQPQTPGGTPQAQGEKPIQDRNVSMPQSNATPAPVINPNTPGTK